MLRVRHLPGAWALSAQIPALYTSGHCPALRSAGQSAALRYAVRQQWARVLQSDCPQMYLPGAPCEASDMPVQSARGCLEQRSDPKGRAAITGRPRCRSNPFVVRPGGLEQRSDPKVEERRGPRNRGNCNLLQQSPRPWRAPQSATHGKLPEAHSHPLSLLHPICTFLLHTSRTAPRQVAANHNSTSTPQKTPLATVEASRLRRKPHATCGHGHPELFAQHTQPTRRRRLPCRSRPRRSRQQRPPVRGEHQQNTGTPPSVKAHPPAQPAAAAACARGTSAKHRSTTQEHHHLVRHVHLCSTVAAPRQRRCHTPAPFCASTAALHCHTPLPFCTSTAALHCRSALPRCAATVPQRQAVPPRHRHHADS